MHHGCPEAATGQYTAHPLGRGDALSKHDAAVSGAHGGRQLPEGQVFGRGVGKQPAAFEHRLAVRPRQPTCWPAPVGQLRQCFHECLERFFGHPVFADQTCPQNSHLFCELVVFRSLSPGEPHTYQRYGKPSDYSVSDRSVVPEPEAGAPEVGVEPRHIAVVVPGVGGSEAQSVHEPGIEREPVNVAAVAVALICDEQAALADGSYVRDPSTVDHGHQHVVCHERIARPRAHTADPEEGGQARFELGHPLLLQLDGRDQHDHLLATPELVEGGRDPDHRLASPRDRLYHPPAALLSPGFQGVRLPGVQPERDRGGRSQRHRYPPSGPLRRL